jgi:DNA polymerase-4
MRQILHVDMDAFYASVEQRDDPSLRGKPVIVGGPSKRGVVTAASYEVRPYGVRSAMSMVEALRRAPHAIVVPGRHWRYAEVSEQVFAIFRRFTPLVEGLSLDEAFLDVTASRSLFGDGEVIARRIKDAIWSELELKASAGVAPSKFVAKIASDLKKPDALVVVREEDVVGFLAPLPIERMWGIGQKSAPRMHTAGFHTLGDLAKADDALLERLFGTWGAEMKRLARGDDPREVDPARDAKSIGSEETFEHDLTKRVDLERALLSQSTRVASRLFAEGLACRGVTVKLKYSDFTIKTRAQALNEAIVGTTSIYEVARGLLDRFELNRRVRLTGVAATRLCPIEETRTLFPDEKKQKDQKLEAVSAALKDRFGSGTITRAALLERSGSLRETGSHGGPHEKPERRR